MDIKKLIIGGITGGILFFLLGWLIYGILAKDFMDSHPGTVPGVDRTEELMIYLALGNLVLGFLVTYIFLKANVRALSDGFVTAGIIGMLMSASYDCILYATTNIASKKLMLADVISFTVMMAIGGAVISQVLRKLNKHP